MYHLPNDQNECRVCLNNCRLLLLSSGSFFGRIDNQDVLIAAHGSSVTCVRFNATGTLLVSSSLDKSVKIWDLQGNCIKTMAEHLRYVNCVAVNSDSSVVASGSNDRSVIIWDITGALTLDSHITGMRSILFKFASNQGDMPIEFICPITHEIMKQPVIAEGECMKAVAQFRKYVTLKSRFSNPCSPFVTLLFMKLKRMNMKRNAGFGTPRPPERYVLSELHLFSFS